MFTFYNNKTILAALIISLLVTVYLPLPAYGGSRNAQKLDTVFWQIEKTGAPVSYLLGTIHISDPEVTRFSPKLNAIINSVQQICLELDMNPQVMLAVYGQMISVNQDLEALIGKQYFARLQQTLGLGGQTLLPLKQLKPWAAMVMVSMPKNQNPMEVMDMRLYQHGRMRGLPVCALESAEEQLMAFNKLSIDDQVIMLKETINKLPEMEGLIRQMKKSYQAGDLDELFEINENYLKDSDSAAWQSAMIELLDQRNFRMLERMEKHMATTSSLFAVGALHLAGENGLVNLLRKKSYSVTAIK